MIGIAAGIAAVRAQEQSAHFLADASEFHANENAHLERAFGAKRVAAVETDRVVVEPRRALADRVRGRFRTDQIGRPHHLRRRGDNRSGRHGVEMPPIQFDVVGCVGDITHFDAEGRTEARLERLVAPIGRRYRQWADQRPIFEVAGARLQIQQRSADFKTMWRACRGDFGSLIDDPRRWRSALGKS